MSAPLTIARRRARAAALIGSTVEWYDYFVFASASALVFGKVFFANSGPLAGTLQSFAVLGVGFLARPLGGLVLGRLGDLIGRRCVLIMTMWTMGIATTAIGLLPTPAQVGILAPILLVILRLIQGFGVGGEWAGAALVAIENAPPDRRARWGSLAQMGTALGAVLATGVFALVGLLPEDAFLAWGWRIPFLLGAVVVAVGLWIRSGLLETIDFSQLEAQRELSTRPVLDSLTRDRVPLMLAVGLRMAENVWGYLVLVFSLTYVAGRGHHTRSSVLLGVSIAILAGVVCYWLAATLADRFGRRPVYLAGSLFGIAFAAPFFWLLGSPSLATVWVALGLGWGVASGFSFALQPAWFAELFDKRTRSTGLSLAFNLATLVSGFTPFLATALLALGHGRPVWIIALLVGLGAVATVCCLLAPDPYGRSLRAAER